MPDFGKSLKEKNMKSGISVLRLNPVNSKNSLISLKRLFRFSMQFCYSRLNIMKFMKVLPSYILTSRIYGKLTEASDVLLENPIIQREIHLVYNFDFFEIGVIGVDQDVVVT